VKEYDLNGHDFIALCDLLKKIGMAPTGGEAKAIIAEGLVLVDGAVELRKRCKIRANQVVEFNGEKVMVK
jgi:ribosome-associated protein